MTFDLFDRPAREASARTGFSGNKLNRLSEKRDDGSVEEALVDSAARIMLLTPAGRLLLKKADAGFEPFFRADELPAFQPVMSGIVLLGSDEVGPVLAAPSAIEPEVLPPTVKAIDFRSIYVQGLLDEERSGALAQAAAMLGWHASHRFCGRCGAETAIGAGGYKRICPNCSAEHFPRTDPVAIMLAVTRDRCLLGRSARFGAGMYSSLAGFIEPGETIEDAVRRETFEEAGVRLGRVAYHASQPWPFPYSLMIGCYGEALNEDLVPDLAELEDCRWFTRKETRTALEGRHPDGIFTPPPGAIAHRLIRDWVEAD